MIFIFPIHKQDLYVPVEAFVWRYMPTSSDLMTNDVIEQVFYFIIAIDSVHWRHWHNILEGNVKSKQK